MPLSFSGGGVSILAITGSGFNEDSFDSAEAGAEYSSLNSLPFFPTAEMIVKETNDAKTMKAMLTFGFKQLYFYMPMINYKLTTQLFHTLTIIWGMWINVQHSLYLSEANC